MRQICFVCGGQQPAGSDGEYEFVVCDDCQNDSEDACDRCHSPACDGTCTEGDALDEITDQQYQGGDEMEDAYWRDADEASDATCPF